MESARDKLRLWIEKAQNCPLLVEVRFVESPKHWPATNVFNEMQGLVRVALECKPPLASEDMELRAALDAISVSPPLPFVVLVLCTNRGIRIRYSRDAFISPRTTRDKNRFKFSNLNSLFYNNNTPTPNALFISNTLTPQINPSFSEKSSLSSFYFRPSLGTWNWPYFLFKRKNK